jgi:hypothetical protein
LKLPLLFHILVVNVVLAAATHASRTSISKEEAKALIDKALQMTEIRTSGSPPFRLRAQLHLSALMGPDLWGTYLLEWAAPDRFYERISFASFEESQIALGDRLWRQRSLPYIPYSVWQMESLIRPDPELQVGDKNKVHKIREVKKDGIHLLCIETSYKGTPKEVCLDPTSGAPLRIAIPDLSLTYEFSDYASIGARVFARQRRLFVGRKLVLEVRVDVIETVPSFPPERFTPPPADAQTEAWCPDPKPAELLKGADWPPFYGAPGRALARPRGLLAVSGVIRRDGRLHNLTVVAPLDKTYDEYVLKNLEHFRYRPASCGAVPIETDYIWEMISR